MFLKLCPPPQIIARPISVTKVTSSAQGHTAGKCRIRFWTHIGWSQPVISLSYWVSKLSVRVGLQVINIKMMMMITVLTVMLAENTGWALTVCQEQSQWLYRWNLPETGDVSFPSCLSSHTSSSPADLTQSASWFLGNCLPLLISARRPKAIPLMRGLPCYMHHYGATLNVAHWRHSANVYAMH